ncbi:MAG: T9SS type A sorting domain-containing protein, partial [Flavobacteriales bacterium]
MGFGYESQPNVAIAAGDMGPASIAETGSSDLKVEIAPNPVLDNVSVSIDASGEGPATVTLLNSLGEVLQKNTPILGGHCVINMSTFDPGVYFLRIHKGDRVITRTLTKL